MILLCSLKLPSEIEIEGEVAQSAQENPNLIAEQLIFGSSLEFDECCKLLFTLLAEKYGQPSNPSTVKSGEVSVSCYTFSYLSSEVIAQVTNEGKNKGCAGFIHVKTVWLPAFPL